MLLDKVHKSREYCPVRAPGSDTTSLETLRKLYSTEMKNHRNRSVPNLSIALLAVAALTIGVTGSATVHAQSLAGSRASMQRQHEEALSYGYSFLKTGQEVTQFVNSGYLVKVTPTANMDLHDVSYPYARPAIKLFIERLSSQYRVFCGEKLVVTSLTRPMNRQPANAASDSVHPTGMAVDLRIPPAGKCRSWLEKTLLSLEGLNVLDVTRERHPAHYHVAVFAKSYERYVASLESPGATVAQVEEYVVRRGDTLSRIATKTGTTVAQLRAANGLRGDLINVGQKLQIPGAAPAPAAPAPTAVVASSDNQVNEINQIASVVTEATHRVRRGDTLWAIANQYRTTVEELRMANNLRGDALNVGQVLQIGVSGSTP